MPLNTKSRVLADRLGSVSLKIEHTSFWEIPKGHRKGVPIIEKPNKACFNSLDYSRTRGVRFLCIWHPKHLTDEHVTWWISFLRSILVDLPWSARIVKLPVSLVTSYYGSPDTGPTDERSAVYYALRKMSPNTKTTLAYLTLMRYPKEYPSVVKKLFEDRALVAADSTGDNLFKLFQEIHQAKDRYKDFRYVVTDHSAVKISYHTNGYEWVMNGTNNLEMLSSATPVSIAAFRERVQSGKAPSVWAHFRDVSLEAAIKTVPILPVAQVTYSADQVAPRPVVVDNTMAVQG